ncbi:MAG: hypothetical protein HY376_03915 [Candidatus Blackburnbacteria bacterium]|nr:hypothetical protein [Candidatus Blackburnbacteria bacterium]
MKEEIYRIIDGFLTEAKDQNGNDRSLERLNADRHLAADELEKLFSQALAQREKEVREAWLEGRRCLTCGNEMEPKETTNTCDKCWQEN